MRQLTLDREKRQAIGLTYVLDQVETASPLSRKTLLRLEYFSATDRQARIRHFQYMKRLNEVMTSSKRAWSDVRTALSDLRDIVPVIKKLQAKIRLDVADLYLLKKHVSLEARLLMQPELLIAGGVSLTDHTRVLTLLHGNRTLEDLYPVRLALSDFDDAELAVARKDLALLQLSLSEVHEPLIEKALAKAEIAEEKVSGLEEKNLLWLEESLLPFVDSLRENQEKLVDLDLKMSKLMLTADYAPDVPRLAASSLSFDEVFHPEEVARLKSGGLWFTPLDISITNGLTLITGANMSGKSVALNTVLLNAILVNMGFMPFARGAVVPLFEAYEQIGDVQGDRSQGLSTFGAEVVAIKKAVFLAEQEKALIVIDEPFRGTNPEEGRLLTSGLSSHLSGQTSFVLMSTHYQVKTDGTYRHYVSGDIVIPTDEPKDEREAVRLLAEHVDYRLKEVTGKQDATHKAIEIAGWLGLQRSILATVERYKLSEEVEDGNAQTE